MNKTLSTYMTVGFTILIMSTLFYGITYQSLKEKHENDVQVIDQFQIQAR